MDPEAILINIRDTVTQAEKLIPQYSVDWTDVEGVLDALVTHVTAMDTWLSHGGFLPPDWSR